MGNGNCFLPGLVQVVDDQFIIVKAGQRALKDLDLVDGLVEADVDVAPHSIGQSLLGLERPFQTWAGNFQEILVWKRIWLDGVQERTDNFRQVCRVLNRDATWPVHENGQDIIATHLLVRDVHQLIGSRDGRGNKGLNLFNNACDKYPSFARK